MNDDLKKMIEGAVAKEIARVKGERDDAIAKAVELVRGLLNDVVVLRRDIAEIHDSTNDIRERIEKLERQDHQRGVVPQRWRALVTNEPPELAQ